MKKRIDTPSLITPDYEDGGLFKKPPTELVVDLIPKFGKNSRGDVIIKGLVKRDVHDVEVDVIFAGRRKSESGELVTLLKRKWDNANYRVAKTPARKEVRLPTRVQGSWRMRVAEVDDEDAQELYTKEYQLLVARWAFNSDTGEFRSFGEPPFQEQMVKRASGSGGA